MKGDHNGCIVDYRNHSINHVGAGPFRLQSRQPCVHCPGPGSDTDNHLAAQESIKGFLTSENQKVENNLGAIL
jgi:hypothetical protein